LVASQINPRATFGTTGTISVVVVNWNRQELLRACLRSLAAQTANSLGQVKVIVVDNGSSDGSPEMLKREFGGPAGLAVTLICNQENRGFCAANNQGIRCIRFQFVALLNNDAERIRDGSKRSPQRFMNGPKSGWQPAKSYIMRIRAASTK